MVRRVILLKVKHIKGVHLSNSNGMNHEVLNSVKLGLSVIESPQPITVIDHKLIDLKQSQELTDVLKDVSGLYTTTINGNSSTVISGRGFGATIYKNGMPVNTSSVHPEVSGLESVEVLKGSTAMLYGRVSPGAFINMVTKKPKFISGGKITFNAGSWNNFKPTLDFHTPLSKSVAVRVNGTYEYKESFRDVVWGSKYYFNPF